MEKRTFLRSTIVWLLLLGTWALQMLASPQIPTTIETKGVAKKCLACHGDYDKLVEKTAKFKTQSGETVSPHQYIPHNEKTVIPDCTECHKAHPIPLEDKSKVDKSANIDWCYGTCHHAGNLQPCRNCH